MFSEKDLIQLKERGINPELVEKQIRQLKKGTEYANIIAPATVEKGIFKPDKTEENRFIDLYDKTKNKLKIVKFVPASGAASRMFKNLFAVLNKEKKFEDDKSFPSAYNFVKNIEKFAFYEDLKRKYPGNDPYKIIEYTLTKKGLNYGNMPKGLIKFHKYEAEERTPVEEHLAEGGLYASSKQNTNIHFTVSPEHKDLFSGLISEKIAGYEKRFGTKYTVDFSFQEHYTDTPALDSEGNIFRNEDGTILFRPGGHGALIENLNKINADIIFVKNIDNTVKEDYIEDTVKYKKVIAGILINTRNKIFDLLNDLTENPTEKSLKNAESFLTKKLSISFPSGYKNFSFKEKTEYLKKLLDRPVRVCGMVKNEGEPGGGPFFVKDKNGLVSLQIIEQAQIDLSDKEKSDILKKSTHFNPVDLVLSVKNHKGEIFDLKKFTDNDAVFISEKSKDGKYLKALELPGLWNGAMADWNTVFAEVPVSTFNPVKTVNDLLRAMHTG